jgi:hypothetical protein
MTTRYDGIKMCVWCEREIEDSYTHMGGNLFHPECYQRFGEEWPEITTQKRGWGRRVDSILESPLVVELTPADWVSLAEASIEASGLPYELRGMEPPAGYGDA